ncbi:MAG: segregation/condensation protein A [Sphingobacteriales bacterium]|nr:MAG: segregation/condensation protein A [Sphingobacteriales bacterium]
MAELQSKPLAIVNGEPWQKLPKDLYIPPQALAVCLAQFEGPLDLLLYLIRKHNLDVLDIPVSSVTQQYLTYIEAMDASRVELAVDYLVMAAYLVEIKSRLLLPQPNIDMNDGYVEDDPRAELVAKLLEYQQLQESARKLDELPRWERDLLPVQVFMPPTQWEQRWIPLILNDLKQAWDVLAERSRVNTHHIILPERLNTQARMGQVLMRLRRLQVWLPFRRLLVATEGRAGVVVTFIAVLELIKEGLIRVEQLSLDDLSVCANEQS